MTARDEGAAAMGRGEVLSIIEDAMKARPGSVRSWAAHAGRFADAILALAAPVSAPGVDREAVARIIDPLTWGKIDKVMAGGLDGLIPEGWSREQYATSCYYEERRDSFAKADQIIALLAYRIIPADSSGEGGEG
ncbi:hypothetical protein [Phenylobacterium sp.]|uniref:hypothetical protein n=1 Tax=Phenylobacterium sp. TaxID=1871053 RepID=UPI00272225A8|nr:hypothetical protein [Phenylobacterium sp.]MDO8800100.1 hypothetical protein [Phenylobacterium sp.]